MPGKEIVQVLRYLPFKNVGLKKKIFHTSINHNYLISRLQCKNLQNCSCVGYVNKLTEKNIEYELDPWIKVLAETDDNWCPMGPPGCPEFISHELEEFYFIPRLEEELYYYHTNPIENPIDELSQEEEEKQLTKEMIQRKIDLYYYHTNPIENPIDELVA